MLSIRPLVFLSGSMSPTIQAGSLALSETVDASEIAVGDIVTVPYHDSYVTHRVVAVTHSTDKATLTLRGDGNKTPDDTVHEVTSVQRTRIWVPQLGYAVVWFSHAPGVYVLAGYVALVLGSLRRARLGPPTAKPPRPGRPKLVLRLGRRHPRRLKPSLIRNPRLARGTGVAAAAISATLAAPSPATAAWSDTLQVTGTTLRTVTPSPPVASCGTLATGSVTVNWTAKPGATHYVLTYGGVGAPTTQVVAAPTTSKVLTDGGKFTVAARFGSTTWESVPSNQLSYSASGQATCAANG
jgi:signal peptidase I